MARRGGAGGPPDIHGMVSLKVDNLTYRTSVEDLKRVFRKHGDVGDVYIPRSPRNNESRGFAFVRFFDRRDAEEAMDALDGYRLDGRELRIAMAKYARPGGRSGRDRSRSRDRHSRRRSRSRSRDRRSKSREDTRRRKSRSGSRKRSPSKEDDRKRSKSPSQDRSRERSNDGGGGGGTGRSRERSRERSIERDASRERDRSRDGSREPSKDRSPSRDGSVDEGRNGRKRSPNDSHDDMDD